ncbi:hypothetical protein FRC07_014392 [Ceratobasidium sp. 392]|nr:hypothetical protein FRC07_014392 [Ceratobasidium sp. 392]
MATTPASVQTWCDASIMLSDAVQHYLDASPALEAASLHSSAYDSDGGTLDELFVATYAEKARADERSRELARAALALNRAHNRSPKLVPILSLPNEILVSIFTLTLPRCALLTSRQYTKIPKCLSAQTLLTITHVCSSWRQIALNVAALWAHVDIEERGPSDIKRMELNELLFSRASASPFSVQVFAEAFFRTPFMSALDQLCPHLHKVHSLYFRSDSNRARPLYYWLKNGTPGSVKELSLIGPECSASSSHITFESTPLDPARVSSFLAPLQVLRLQGMSLDWESSAYHGLVHLELFDIPPNASPTLQQLNRILSVCPKLRVLRLGLQNITEVHRSLQPVALNMLETLDLFDTPTTPCSHILPMITPGPTELFLRISTKRNLDLILSLSNRSNITGLYITMSLTKHAKHFSRFLASFKNLRALAIDFLGCSKEICNTALDELAHIQDPDSLRFVSGWDKLDALWLINGDLDVECLKNVIGVHPIRTLILTNVTATPDEELLPYLRPFVDKIIVEGELDDFDVSNWYTRI